jgi:hypothetical protein
MMIMPTPGELRARAREAADAPEALHQVLLHLLDQETYLDVLTAVVRSRLGFDSEVILTFAESEARPNTLILRGPKWLRRVFLRDFVIL